MKKSIWAVFLLSFFASDAIGQGAALLGVTNYGGSTFAGTLFMADADGRNATVLLDFGTTQGREPVGKLLRGIDGKYYGLTKRGGVSDKGILFEYDLKSNSFVKTADMNSIGGQAPNGTLVQSSKNGKIYGTCQFGGDFGHGNLFEYDPNTRAISKKIDFDPNSYVYGNARYPSGNLIELPDGKLIGTGANTLFEVDISSGSYRTPYEFPSQNEVSISLGSEGLIYGTNWPLETGDGSGGSLFLFDVRTDRLSTLFDFSSSDFPTRPTQGVVELNNKLYGTTEGYSYIFYGTLFEFDLAKRAMEKRADFDYHKLGGFPSSSLTIVNEKLYGMADQGDDGDFGLIFEFDPASSTLKKTFEFKGGTDIGDNNHLTYQPPARTTPTITWANPANIVYSTALSSTQLNATTTIPGTFSYSPAIGTQLNAGSQTLSVTFTPTDAVNYTIAARSVTINVTKATPIITWNNPANIVFGTTLSSTQLNAATTIPGTFSYTPTSGTQLNASSQTLSVTFTPTDAVNYTTATRSVTINVTKATPIITWNNPANIVFGTALSSTQLNATTTIPGTFAYSPAIGTQLNAGSQSLSVTFTPTDAVNYTTATRSVTINVTKANPIITWNNPTDIVYGTALSSIQLNATTTIPGTFAYIPASSIQLNAGSQTLSVTFTPTDAVNYTTATRSVTMNVTKATPTITWNNPADIVYGTALSSTQLNATTTILGTFAYSPAIGTQLNAGSQTLSVTFTPTDAVNYTTATRSVTINVTKATPIITWNNPANIVFGKALSSTQLNATTTIPGTFAYSPAIGTQLNAGSQSLSVTFTPTDAVNYTTATRSVTINVIKATPIITWNNPTDIVFGTALSSTQLNATAGITGVFVYTPAIGTQLNIGANQTLSVTFTPADAVNYASASKQVTLNVVDKGSPIVTWANPTDIVYGTALSNTQLNATTTIPGTFVYTPTNGIQLNAGSQTLSVTFTPTDEVNYKVATKTVTLNVTKATPTITWANPANIVFGTALSITQLNANTNISGTFAYTPAIGMRLNAGSQTLSVTFTPTDTVNYTTATRSVTIIVTKITPTITWANPTDIVYGTSLSSTQLNATTTIPGTFVYTPASGIQLNAGSQTLSVMFTPTDAVNYNSATRSVTMNVTKATPTITWNNPADIVFGAPIGDVQLNATSNIAGTFEYSPTSGTQLNLGTNQILSVTFTPTDGANYTNSSKQVILNVVDKASPTIIWNSPADIVYGTPLSDAQLNATTTIAGTFVYAPAIGTVLNAGSQTLSATFTPADAVNYNRVTRSFTINVAKASPSITWIDPTDMVYGTVLSNAQLNATTSIAGTFEYAPSIGSILNAGSQTLSVTFTPTDALNYTTTNTQVIVNVAKASQQITFSTIPDKTFGDGSFVLSVLTSSGLPINFTSPSDKISIVGNRVTILKSGRVSIFASQAGNINFIAAERIEQSFCIKPMKPIITLTTLNSPTPILNSNYGSGNQWYLEEEIILGAVNQELTAQETGTYKVQVKVDDCLSEFSASQPVVITGDIAIADYDVSIYPNPVDDLLIIKSKGNELSQIRISDMTGKEIDSKKVRSNELEFNVSHYASGVYIVKVERGNKVKVSRFVKK